MLKSISSCFRKIVLTNEMRLYTHLVYGLSSCTFQLDTNFGRCLKLDHTLKRELVEKKPYSRYKRLLILDSALDKLKHNRFIIYPDLCLSRSEIHITEIYQSREMKGWTFLPHLKD